MDKVEQMALDAMKREPGQQPGENASQYAKRIATAALREQPEARGVVDEGSRIVTSQLLHWGGIPVRVTGTVTTSPGNWPLIDAALTETRNG